MTSNKTYRQMLTDNTQQNDITRDMLNKIRALQGQNINENMYLTEETVSMDKKNNGIAITDDPRFGENVLSNQIKQFRSAVESGAQFSKVDDDDVSQSPLIYLPDSGNLVFSGVIPCLNNLKFQFVLKTSTGNGCFLWGDGVILNQDNIKILNKLYGFYQNWVEQWNLSSGELEKMAKILQND